MRRSKKRLSERRSAPRDGKIATLSFRFRPSRRTRDLMESQEKSGSGLRLDDYEWQIIANTSGVDLNAIEWNTDYGVPQSIADLQQGFLVVFLEALRDVELRLRQSRHSPLVQLFNDEDFPEDERKELVNILREANDKISAKKSITDVGGDIKASLDEAAGEAFSLGLRIGLTPPTFGDLKKGLALLLSDGLLKDFSPERNGLGLNNVLYVAMVLRHFHRRKTAEKTAGELLLI